MVIRIAVNCAKNHLVAGGRKPPGSDIDVEDAEMYDSGEALRENASPEKLLLTNEIKEVVFKTIEQLPEDLRNSNQPKRARRVKLRRNCNGNGLSCWDGTFKNI